MKRIALIAIVVSATSATAMAGGYRSAGCGLGSDLIKDDGIVQIFAATTNGTSGNQTFGITSGTSNCTGSGGYAQIDAEKQMYVEANYDALSQEMAQGAGEHLGALSSLMGCSRESSNQFASVMKKNYSSIAASQGAESMLTKVKTTISSDPVL